MGQPKSGLIMKSFKQYLDESFVDQVDWVGKRTENVLNFLKNNDTSDKSIGSLTPFKSFLNRILPRHVMSSSVVLSPVSGNQVRRSAGTNNARTGVSEISIEGNDPVGLNNTISHELAHQWQSDQSIQSQINKSPISTLPLRYNFLGLNTMMPKTRKYHHATVLDSFPADDLWNNASHIERLNYRKTNPEFVQYENSRRRYYNNSSEINARSVAQAVVIRKNYHNGLRNMLSYYPKMDFFEAINTHRDSLLNGAIDSFGVEVGILRPEKHLSLPERKSLALHSQDVISRKSRIKFKNNMGKVLSGLENELPKDIDTLEGRQQYIDQGV